MLKVWKELWEPFRSYLLNSTANLAHFHPSLAGLAVLFSRQLPNGSHNFFQTFRIILLNYFIKNPQITIALPFLTHNISAIGGVLCCKQTKLYFCHIALKSKFLVKMYALPKYFIWYENSSLICFKCCGLVSSKDQIISERIFVVWNIPKKQQNFFKDFCPSL